LRAEVWVEVIHVITPVFFGVNFRDEPEPFWVAVVLPQRIVLVVLGLLPGRIDPLLVRARAALHRRLLGRRPGRVAPKFRRERVVALNRDVEFHGAGQPALVSLA